VPAMTTDASREYSPDELAVCAILDGLADLLELAAAEQVRRSTSDRDDLAARADMATTLAENVRGRRAHLVPTAINPNTGDTMPGDGYGVIGEWRRALNRALTHARLGNIE
jgi:hypothetical protein